MKRLIDIIQQDKAIWELSQEQVELIMSKGIYNKIDELQTYGISENDMIDGWVGAFKELMPSFEAEIIPYQNIDTYAQYTWAKENPNSWIHL